MPNDKHPQRTLSLPDPSMNHVSTTSLSNSVVMAGGLAYVALALWDWLFIQQQQQQQLLLHASSGSSSHYWYNALSLSAPLMYLLNSVLDIVWAARAHTSIPHHTIQRDTPLLWHQNSKPDTAHGQTTTTTTVLAAALTFWMAASLAMVAAVLRHSVVANHHVVVVSILKKEAGGGLLDMASDHVYIVSAILAILAGNPTTTRLTTTTTLRGNDHHHSNKAMFYNNPELLKNVGDLLFLIGTLVDGSMWYFPHGQEPIWSFLSSVVWVLDAYLYVRSSNLVSSSSRSNQPHEKGTKVLYD